MKKIIVERVEEYTNNIKRYEVITEEESMGIISNYNVAENVVDVSYDLGYTIEIDLETGEIYETINDGSFSLGDTTTIRRIYYKERFYDFSSIDESIVEYDGFEEFKKQYQDWENEIEREYDYKFDNKYYRNEYEAFIGEVLGEDVDEFIRNYRIETLEAEIGSEIYEDTYNFYDEAKVIEEL